ncbi:MAG TPA: hypothetical protein VHN15_02720, partial [Thermoanaerobaculia bacterium]|nr:hypothetical protein [Thermoanaerobaculia bacterium]
MKDYGDPVWFTQPLLPPLRERRDLPTLRLPAQQKTIQTVPRRGTTPGRGPADLGKARHPGR